MKLTHLSSAFAVLLLSGCSSIVGIGDSEFACSSGDKNALCGSAGAIYRATDGPLIEDDTITYVRDGEVVSSSQHDQEQHNNNDGRHVTDVPFKYSNDGSVLRSDVGVLRVWLSPWIDDADNFHSSQLIYTDIEPRKWNVGVSKSSNERRQWNPLPTLSGGVGEGDPADDSQNSKWLSETGKELNKK